MITDRDETMDLLRRFWNGEPLSDEDLERALVEVRKVQRNLDEAVYRLERENAALRGLLRLIMENSISKNDAADSIYRKARELLSGKHDDG